MHHLDFSLLVCAHAIGIAWRGEVRHFFAQSTRTPGTSTLTFMTHERVYIARRLGGRGRCRATLLRNCAPLSEKGTKAHSHGMCSSTCGPKHASPAPSSNSVSFCALRLGDMGLSSGGGGSGSTWEGRRTGGGGAPSASPPAGRHGTGEPLAPGSGGGGSSPRTSAPKSRQC